MNRSGNGPVLFSCGAFYERKGFPLLIEAFARIASKHPGARLRIAGSGEQRVQVEAAIAQHSLGDRVDLLGFVPHETVIEEMCRADAFILIGWDEPFATVFTEALSAGKPVICANDGGINDVLQNEVHGLTVPPKNVAAASDAIDRILADTGLRTRLGANAADLFSTSLTWDHNAARMAEIFHEAARKQNDAGQ
jgi:glycosyltransferase involved in cell wall biosynthesis